MTKIKNPRGRESRATGKRKHENSSKTQNSLLARDFQENCGDCCFFSFVGKKKEAYGLCHLLGEREPFAGMEGCRFIPGKWDPELDNFCDLSIRATRTILNVPNLTKPCDRLANKRFIANYKLSANLSFIAFSGSEEINIGGIIDVRISARVRQLSLELGSVGDPAAFFNPKSSEAVQ